MIRYNRKKILQCFTVTKRKSFRNLLDSGLRPTEASALVSPDGQRFYSYPPSFFGLYSHIVPQSFNQLRCDWDTYIAQYEKIVKFLHKQLKKHCKEYKKLDALTGRKFVAFERAGDDCSE